MKKKEEKKNLTNFVQIKERIMVYKELFIHRGQIIKPDEEQKKLFRKRTKRRILSRFTHVSYVSNLTQIYKQSLNNYHQNLYLYLGRGDNTKSTNKKNLSYKAIKQDAFIQLTGKGT
jgi:predicted RNA-binding protein YlxR (DUF448 family)